MLGRVLNGFKYLRQAVKLAPDAWTAMLVRILLRPEFHKFSFDILSALVLHSSHKTPETFWLCMSRLIHKLVDNNNPPTNL